MAILQEFKDPAVKALFRKLKDAPIFDALEDAYDHARFYGVIPGSHPHWELELAWAEDAYWDLENNPPF